jgi:hypothetical protein
MIIEVDLLGDDWALIRRALETAGHSTETGLLWLLEQGLEMFSRDEAEWRSLEGKSGHHAQTRRQELERREAQALLVSMRVRTIASERLMHELSETVHALGATLRNNREEMWPLRREADALDARLRALQATLDRPLPTPTRRWTLGSRLGRLLGRGGSGRG